MHLPHLLLITVAAAPLGPNDMLRAAVHDLETSVAPSERYGTRYATLHHLPEAERSRAGDVLSWVLNSVSRAAVIICPEAVPGTHDALWRIRYADYELPPEVWEQLAARDPYFHVRTRVLVPGSGFQVQDLERRKPTRNGSSSTLNPEPRTLNEHEVFTDGGWLDLAAGARLRELTGSGGAVLRGDHLIAQAATTLDGGVYYALAGVPETEDQFFAALGLDVATIGELQADAGANLFRSLVTFKPRRVVRRQGPLGGAWHTYDTAAATPERDPIRNPLDFVYDAGEHIAAKRNGLHVYALFDAAGRRQSTVPDVIAKDASDPHGAGIVVPMISCVRCHVEDGLRPVADDQRRLLAAGIELFTAERRDAQRLAAFYFADLDKQLRRDREDYAEAVGAATGGMTGAEATAALAQVVDDYAFRLVDLAHAAAELGTSADALRAALRNSHDPILLALSVGVAVDRKQWEASFAEAAVLLPSPLAGEGPGVRGRNIQPAPHSP